MADEIVTIHKSLLENIANAIREKKGTTGKIAVPDFPMEISTISGGGGGDVSPLTLTMIFDNQRPSNASGSAVLFATDSDYNGNYDLYWADDSGILTNYTKLNIITTLSVVAGEELAFQKFFEWNAIPKYATKLVAVLSNDESKTTKASFTIPASKRWTNGGFGNHIGSIGVISDVHYQYESGSTDWATCFTYLDERESIDAIVVAGDLTSHGTQEHLDQWKTARDTYAVNTPVYACNGNHESYNESAYMVTNPENMRQYLDTDYVDETENYFTKTISGVLFAFVPIFEGVEQDDRSVMFSSTVLAWLEALLEEHRNERVVIVAHCPPDKSSHPYGFADGQGIYDTRKMWGYGGVNTMQDRKDFLALLSHYKNVIWISGHTHLKYQYHEAFDNHNIVRYSTDCAFMIHVSSLTVPRDIIDGSISGYIYAESEGTILDIYPNVIRVRTRNFIDGKFYGLEEYLIDAPLVTIPASSKTLVGLSASKQVVNYYVGDTLALNDITTIATFDDTSTQVVQGVIDASQVNMAIAGSYSITVSYTFGNVTQTATIPITVSDRPQQKELSNLSASKEVINYYVNDILSTNDISAIATYSDATSQDISQLATIDVTQVDMSTAGTYPIGVLYSEGGITKTATVTITVSNVPSGDWQVVTGKHISSSTNEISDNADYYITTPFPVDGGNNYELHSFSNGTYPRIRAFGYVNDYDSIATWHSSELWRGGDEVTHTCSVPANVRYVRLDVNVKYLNAEYKAMVNSTNITFTKVTE